MKKIKLKPKGLTIVDDEDYEWLSQWTWRGSGRNYQYVYRFTHIGSHKDGTRRQVSIPMHRQIINAPKDKQVDHINGKTLDNRKINLRLCSNVQNHQNMKRPINNTSGYKGVRYSNGKWRKQRWQAEITYNGKTIFLGYRKTAKEAGYLYDQVALQLFKEFARTNIL